MSKEITPIASDCSGFKNNVIPAINAKNPPTINPPSTAICQSGDFTVGSFLGPSNTDCVCCVTVPNNWRAVKPFFCFSTKTGSITSKVEAIFDLDT